MILPTTLVSSISELQNICVQALDDPEGKTGIDIETSGLHYPDNEVIGVSLYVGWQGTAHYIPLRHHDTSKNLPVREVVEKLSVLGDESTFVGHNIGFDLTFLCREGVRFHSVEDSMLIAQLLQLGTVSLKPLACDFAVVSYQRVRSFEQMIAEVNGLDVNDVLQRDIDELVQEYPVAGIDPENTVYLDYVGLDAALPVHLMPHLVERHDELVGDPDAAEEIRRVQFDAAAMFAWDGAHGYEIDVDVLDRFVVQYQKDFADSSLNFRREVRQIMGWEEQEPKEGDGVVSETTSTPAWSL